MPLSTLRSLGFWNLAWVLMLGASCANHGNLKDPPNPSGPSGAAPLAAKSGGEPKSPTPVASGEASCTNEPAATCASSDAGSTSAEASVLLAIPFAGNCRFGDCLKNGWDGEVHADCKFSDCAKDGWNATLASGSASTDCSFQKCFSSGWSTQLADGSRIDASCNFGNCLKDGWNMRVGNDSISVTCQFSDCTKHGFDIALPSGKRVSCSCNFGDCAKNGASCH